MKHVLLIGTGGTITASTIGRLWKPGSLTEDFLLKLLPLKDIKIKTKSLFRIDSSDMQPEFWIDIAKTIYAEIEKNKYNGVVITHGTDTMSYTASALSFLLQDLNVPIVLTGAQLPLSEPGSDVKRNLLGAIKVAAETDIGEVVIVFNGNILRGCRSRKVKETGFDAFQSINSPVIGRVLETVKITSNYRKISNKKPKLYTELEKNVALLKLYPGFSPDIFHRIIDMGYKGFVVEGFGACNVPVNYNSLISCIQRAKNENIPVVISTQCVDGYDWTHLYENGQKALQAGGIPAYDMLSETALVKLMWVLKQTDDMEEI
ncbi:MAG: asparaginase, partial [Candidatus Aenigmatarchaeota archaeon]